ncbi:serine-aspartate repeat-containing protein C, partial [Listeria seeligeri FSL S4-171]
PDGSDADPLNPDNNKNGNGSNTKNELKASETSKELPTTGDENSNPTTLFGVIMGLLGTILLKRRPKKTNK